MPVFWQCQAALSVMLASEFRYNACNGIRGIPHAGNHVRVSGASLGVAAAALVLLRVGRIRVCMANVRAIHWLCCVIYNALLRRLSLHFSIAGAVPQYT